MIFFDILIPEIAVVSTASQAILEILNNVTIAIFNAMTCFTEITSNKWPLAK